MPYKDWRGSTDDDQEDCGYTWCAEHMLGDMPCPKRNNYNPDNPAEMVNIYKRSNS